MSFLILIIVRVAHYNVFGICYLVGSRMHEVVAEEENECGCFGPVSIVWLLRSCSKRGVTEIFGFLWSPLRKKGLL